MAIALELAKDGDLPAIVALMNRAFRGAESERGWSTEAGIIAGTRTTESLLREEIAGGASYLLAKDDRTGALQGSVSLKRQSPETWHLGALTVDPAMQNAGFGRKLLEAAEEHAALRGARVIEMSVISIREALIAWYERRGYRRTGESQPFPYGDDRYGNPTRDDLEFVVLEKHLSR